MYRALGNDFENIEWSTTSSFGAHAVLLNVAEDRASPRATRAFKTLYPATLQLVSTCKKEKNKIEHGFQHHFLTVENEFSERILVMLGDPKGSIAVDLGNLPSFFYVGRKCHNR